MGLETRKGFMDMDADFERAPSIFVTLKAGSNRLRLLPAGYLVYNVHYIKKYFDARKDSFEDTGLRGMISCLKTYDKPCPVCNLSSIYYKTDREAEKKLGSILYRKQRYLFAVISREKLEDGDEHPVKILAVGVTVAKMIGELVNKYGDPADPAEGYDFIVDLIMAGPGNEYNKYTVEPNVEFIKGEKGQRGTQLVLSPLTKEEQALAVPKFTDYVEAPDEGVVEGYFGPIIVSLKNPTTGSVVEEHQVKEEAPVLGSGIKDEEPAPPTPPTGDKPPVAKGKQPRCYGEFDAGDKENCLCEPPCVWNVECAANPKVPKK